jgi:hypothetical protein
MMNWKICDMKRKLFKFQVDSFGYGDDHDENVLDMIASSCNGKFYYIKTLSFIDECFIDCFGDLMSNFAKDVELEVHLANGVQFEYAAGNAYEISSKRVATVKLNGLATGKELNFIAEISIDVKKKPFKLGEEIKIGNVDLNFVSGKGHYSFDAKLSLKTVKTNKEKGVPDVEVEENYVELKALKVMDESRKKFSKGMKKESKWMMDDFINNVQKQKHLREDLKRKIKTLLQIKNVGSTKRYVQVRYMLGRNLANPDFVRYSGVPPWFHNKRQKKMRKKRGIK